MIKPTLYIAPPTIERTCPKCGHRHASLLLRTDFALYLECDRCEHEWNDPARLQSNADSDHLYKPASSVTVGRRYSDAS